MSISASANRWLRRRSARELIVRARQATAIARERHGPLGRGTELTDAQLLASLALVRTADAGHWTTLRGAFRSPGRAIALEGWRDPARTAEHVLRLAPDEARRITDLAESALEGRLTLLGHGELSLGHPLPWHIDPVSGLVSPRVHWSRIRHLDARRVGDHKVTWEVNRHRHLVLLAQAYLLTGESRYASAWVRTWRIG